ncbi:hypothetical protein VNO77_22917 [Canavalia gladiata]|uniref:Uncharacterized protein n=1 Tax=Canavalia gladiata TaxID=3824 RepID=A0AAN9L3H7_CANGL
MAFDKKGEVVTLILNLRLARIFNWESLDIPCTCILKRGLNSNPNILSRCRTNPHLLTTSIEGHVRHGSSDLGQGHQVRTQPAKAMLGAPMNALDDGNLPQLEAKMQILVKPVVEDSHVWTLGLKILFVGRGKIERSFDNHVGSSMQSGSGECHWCSLSQFKIDAGNLMIKTGAQLHAWSSGTTYDPRPRDPRSDPKPPCDDSASIEKRREGVGSRLRETGFFSLKEEATSRKKEALLSEEEEGSPEGASSQGRRVISGPGRCRIISNREGILLGNQEGRHQRLEEVAHSHKISKFSPRIGVPLAAPGFSKNSASSNRL